jgi:succinate dehydrogenase/fumarate reductase flavoprotein subunit
MVDTTPIGVLRRSYAAEAAFLQSDKKKSYWLTNFQTRPLGNPRADFTPRKADLKMSGKDNMSGDTTSSFDWETDVVVVGYGFAGGSAAITARDHGADVLILEKMPRGGGNSRFSYGGTFVVRDDETAIHNLVAWLDAMSLGTTPEDVLEAFVRGTLELPSWIQELGGRFTSQAGSPTHTSYPRTVAGPNFPDIARSSDMFDKLWLGDDPMIPPSQRLWELISSNVDRRQIEVRTDAPVLDIIMDEGRAVGVVAEIDGTRHAIRARDGVVISCGGFANNPELTHDYVASKPLMFAGNPGNPGNTGDGIALVTRAGALLWHMTRTSTFIGYQSPDFEAAFCIFFHGTGFVWIDKHGRRYVDETSVELHDFDRIFSYLNPRTDDFPRNPSWAVFDEETRLGGPLTWSMAGYNRETYKWSNDNSAEVDKGWIIRAESLEDLAPQIGVSVSELTNTIARYNAACAAQVDSQFGRPAATLSPLRPPFYAIQTRPVALNTQGGAKRDAAGRVISTTGSPIPNLYSAGEFGSIWGYRYPGGGNITEALVSGRTAGLGAATGDRRIDRS